jgi:hypothetical protein
VTATSAASARRKTAGIASLIAALGLGLLAILFLPPEPGSSPWKGYRVLLVEKAVPEGELLANLRQAGVDRVLCESTQPVAVSDWARPESMSLAAARESLAPGDPRLDGYLQRLGLWFEARAGGVDYRAYYLEGSILDGSLERGLQRYKGRFILPDETASPPSSAGDSLTFCLVLVLLAVAAALGPFLGKTSLSQSLLSRKPGRMVFDRWALRLSLLAPWAVLASGGRSAAAVAALWGLAFSEIADSLDLPLDEFRRGGGRKAAFGSLARQGRLSPALVSSAVLALAISPGSIVPAALACLGSLAAAAGYALVSSNPGSRKRFVPMPIDRFRSRRGPSVSGIVRCLLACAVVTLWAAGSLLMPQALPLFQAGIAYPTPMEVHGAVRPSITEARSRSHGETGAILPGIASYLEHRAIQEALPYVPIGEGRPDPFAPANMPLPGGRSQILSFSGDWARQAYAALPRLSVEGMLVAQGAATVGRAGGAPAAPVRNRRPLAPIEWLLYIFLLVPPIARLLRGVAPARGVLSGELRQEA